MIFKETHKTKDNLFYVELPKNLDFKLLEKREYWVSANRTDLKIQVYNTKTNQLSMKSLYLSKNNRLYFKGMGGYWAYGNRYYYLDELLVVDEK